MVLQFIIYYLNTGFHDNESKRMQIKIKWYKFYPILISPLKGTRGI